MAKKSEAKKTIAKNIKKKSSPASKKLAAKKTKKIATKTKPKQAAKPAVKKKPAKAVKKVAAKAVFKAHHTALNAGMPAPDFSGIDQNGQLISLKSLKGKTVILYFYPKDDTPGCTATACSLRNGYEHLSQLNYAVIGVSADDQKSHAKFAKKYDLPFPLLADTKHDIINAYDVWGKKQFMGRIFDGIIRTTFIINPDGTIKEVITKVDTQAHTEQILGEQ